MPIERFTIADRASWLAMRTHDLTASDLGAAMGIDPYRSALRLYAEKTNLILPDPENKLMRRGQWLESAGEAALRDEFPTWDFRNPRVYLRDSDCRLGATPDRIAEDPDEPGLINCQIKVVSAPVFERSWHDAPPFHYTLQTLAEGYLLDARRSILAALIIDTYSAELAVFDVPRHAEAEERLRQIARQFWDNIDNGRRPAPDYGRDGDTVAAIYNKPVKGVSIDLSSDNRLPEVLRERAALKAEIERDRERLDALETEIKDKIGDAETADLPGWKLSWKQQTRKAYTVAESTYRVLRVTEKADGTAA